MGWMPAPIELSAWTGVWMQQREAQTGFRPTLREALLDFNVGYVACIILAIAFLSLGALVMHGTGTAFSDPAAPHSPANSSNSSGNPSATGSDPSSPSPPSPACSPPSSPASTAIPAPTPWPLGSLSTAQTPRPAHFSGS
jgi:hypothetical protein